MGFWSDLFGGPSAQEQQLATQEDNLAQTMAGDFQQRFGAQSAEFQQLSNALSPIVGLGVNQQGFSPEELSVMNARAINAAGAAARNAAQATGTVLAGRGGGGTSGITSGIEAAIRGTEASAAETQLSGALADITLRNYETGRENFFKATGGMQALANAENPEAFASLASSSTQQAFADAQTIQKQKQAAAFGPIGLIAKAGGALLGGLAGGLGNLDTTGSSTFGEQLGNFGAGFLGQTTGGPSTLAGIPE